MEQQALGCLSENELLAWVSSTLPPDRLDALDQHLDTCSSCRTLVAEAAVSVHPSEPPARGMSTFSVGETVAGRYVIVRWLGAGGMGEVYEAEDTWLDGLVALKTIAPTIADDRAALARLKVEVRLARRVTHENVCRVFDLGFHVKGRERIALLSMELLRGVTLRQYLKDAHALSVRAVLPLATQIVSALANAHQAGVVHRDLKTDNVMLVSSDDDSQPRAVVTDFGLARSALAGESEALTPNSHRVLGTLDYMSPEQVQGQPATPASDIFSLGVVLYELLTGELPFAGDSPLARALLRVTTKAPRLRDIVAGIPTEWDQCVARCLALRPAERFSDVRQVTQALTARNGQHALRSSWAAISHQSLRFVAAASIGAAACYVADRTLFHEHSPLPAARAVLTPSMPPMPPVPKLAANSSPAAPSITHGAAPATSNSAAPSLPPREPTPDRQARRTAVMARPSPSEKTERDYATLIDIDNPYARRASAGSDAK